jgi:eukaryotic translation initiation factor 2C
MSTRSFRFVHSLLRTSHIYSNTSQALHTAIRQDANERMPSRGRLHYTDTDSLTLGFGLQVWRAYFMSLRPSIGRLLLNIDVSSIIICEPGPLIALCRKYLQLQRDSDLARLNQSQYDILKNFITGILIIQSGTQRRFTIRGLTRNGANRATFPLRSGDQERTTRVADYFAQNNRRLTHPDCPCVIVSALKFSKDTMFTACLGCRRCIASFGSLHDPERPAS